MYRLKDKHQIRRLQELILKEPKYIRIGSAVNEWALLQTLPGSSENRILNIVSPRRLEKFGLGASLSEANNEKKPMCMVK